MLKFVFLLHPHILLLYSYYLLLSNLFHSKILLRMYKREYFHQILKLQLKFLH